MPLAKDTLKLYYRESLTYRKRFFAALIFVPLSSILFGVMIPFLLSRIIELLSQGQRLGDGQFMQVLYATIAVGIVAIIVNRFGHKHILQLDSDMRALLQRKAFNNLLHKSYNFYANNKVGALTSHFIGFTTGYSRLLNIILGEFITITLTLLAGITIVFFNSPILGITLLSITVLIITHALYGSRRRAPLRRKRKKLISELHGIVADNISNNFIIKMFGKEHVEAQTIHKKVESLRRVFRKDFAILNHEGNIRHAIMFSFQVIAIIVCAFLLQEGTITLGLVIFSLTYLTRLSTNLFSVAGMVNGFDQAMVDATPMAEILLQENEVQDKPGAKKLKVTRGKINFNNISFSYEDGAQQVFSNLTLQIAPQEKVGLVGTSGGGKTTITKLLLRFVDIQKGSIEIDSQNIAAVTQQSLREHIAYVPQEPLLFHRSLRENIAYANPSASQEAIINAARKAYADEFIQKLPHKYDTIVGEKGVKLSGGQRQRIAIARAILADAPILVLDEATSALDSESEKAIQGALQNLMKQKTTIVIAHRLSTIQKMDRIIVLDNGKIAEQGNHQTLLEKRGTYATLWAHQSGGFIET